jgi:aminoglycoside phosphotransferase (APT) family kinase protein
MTLDTDVAERLTGWLRTQLPDADDVRVEGLDRVNFGHSAEMMVLTIVTRNGSQDVVLRLRPKPPALLEPYDLARQFKILRALQDSAVRVPRALWLEDSGDVLGRPFFVMERVGGDVYEMEAPADAAGETVARMCQSLAEQLATIHSVDLQQSGLDALDDGSNPCIVNSTIGQPKWIGSSGIRCPLWSSSSRRYATTHPSPVRKSPWCTGTRNRATSRSPAVRSARSSTGR